MVDTAAWLVDRVLPDTPVRQWVLALPHRIRCLCAYDPPTFSGVDRIFLRAIASYYERNARDQGLCDPRIGYVAFTRRFDSAFGRKVHFHTSWPDGTFTRPPLSSEEPTFHPAAAITDSDIDKLACAIRRRVLRFPRKHGRRAYAARMGLRLLLLLTLAVLACTAGPHARPDAGTVPEPTPMRMMTPAPVHPFVHGPALADGPALAQWLAKRAADGARPVVRLPVLVLLANPPSTVRGARLLGAAPDAATLTLDDSALGIGLADRARQACPGAAECPLWLEGRWTGAGFAVTHVGAVVSDAERQAGLTAGLELPGARAEVVALVERLSSSATSEEKEATGRALVASGVDAIPVLIAALDDGRAWETRDVANRMNLPNNAKVEPLIVTRKVGERCRELLHEVVTPAPTAPPKGNLKLFSPQVLLVDDWPGFWAKRRGKTLAQIHDELRPLVDAYFASGGTPQRVP